MSIYIDALEKLCLHCGRKEIEILNKNKRKTLCCEIGTGISNSILQNSIPIHNKNPQKNKSRKECP